MTKVLVALADGFEEVEALTPVDILRRAGAFVQTCSIGNKVVKGRSNIEVVCDITMEQVISDDYDAIVIPGGMPGATNLANSKELAKIILNAFHSGKLVAAICASPVIVLEPLGILNSKTAVCYPGMETDNPLVKYSTEKVFRDKNIITGRGMGCAVDFSLELVKALFGDKKAEDISSSIVF